MTFAEPRLEKIRALVPAVPSLPSFGTANADEERIEKLEKKLATLSRKVTILTKSLETADAPKKAAPKKAAAKKTTAKKVTKRVAKKADVATPVADKIVEVAAEKSAA